MTSSNTDFALQEIMENDKLCAFFQPIVSLKTGSIFAYEALIRGIRDDSPVLIPPLELFKKAKSKTESQELDHHCRKKALESFKQFHTESNAMMFLNINTSTIGPENPEHPQINIVANQMGFDPQHIGLELIESESFSSKELISFVTHYRESGFLIVIDDFGCEHSNIDRLIQIHPDVIKVDRSIIANIESDPYRQSILKSINSLAQMTGALCLAEGVETIEEIQTCHLLGVDLFQGYAFALPNPDLPTLEKETLARIKEVQDKIRQITLDSLRVRRRLTGDINVLAEWLVRQIDPHKFDCMNLVFQEFMAMNSEIECIYLLDSFGVQISDTISSPDVLRRRRPIVFYPALKGTNHSFKPYFTCFEALRVKRYLTDVYLSLASGNLCRTFSVQIENDLESYIILCIDFLEEKILIS
ncbi:MAG TPA: EAL domain-containing protein [Treponema sp.]|nr:EAL domain-containing protein [Treponema sp.]